MENTKSAATVFIPDVSMSPPNPSNNRSPKDTTKPTVLPSSPFGANLAEIVLRGRALEKMGTFSFCATFAKNTTQAQRDCATVAEMIKSYDEWSRINW